MEFEELLIKEYDHWEVFLHENQYYLGRNYIWAKREDALDFFDMNNAERQEYFQIGNKIKQALKKSFDPDLFNYATLANISAHLHTHVIPRYQSEREFNGILFRDGRWKKNYAPYDYDFKVSDETLIKIRDKLKENI